MIDNSKEIVEQMFSKDRFGKHLGIKILKVALGFALLEMEVREDMLNGFDILHGGVCYSLADTCLAFASNSHGKKSVSLSAKMSYIEPVKAGDILVAESVEISVTKRTAIYDVFIRNQNHVLIGIFRGTVYRTSKNFF